VPMNLGKLRETLHPSIFVYWISLDEAPGNSLSLLSGVCALGNLLARSHDRAAQGGQTLTD